MKKKIEIRKDFVVIPHAQFSVGEVLDVEDKLADVWIAAGRAVQIGQSQPSPSLALMLFPKPFQFYFPRRSKRERANRKGHYQTRMATA